MTEPTENLPMLSENALASLILPNLINPSIEKVKILMTGYIVRRMLLSNIGFRLKKRTWCR